MSIRGIRRALSIPRFTRRHVERDIDEELAYHIARRAERLHAEGMSSEDAHAEAARRFGDLSTLRDECVDIDHGDLRQERLMDFIDHTISDLRFAARSFRRAPGFAITALVTLVVGIAALTSIFSFFNAVYYARLPYRDADRIVAISEERARGPLQFSAVSLEALPLVRGAHSFERFSAYKMGSSAVLFGTDPQPVATLAVDTAFSPLFALRAEVGRLLRAEEITSGSSAVMISDQLWRARYGADSSAIGKQIVLNARSFTIVGVMQPGFRFPYQTDAIIPLSMAPDSTSPVHDPALGLLGKLRPGVTLKQARGELAVISPRLASIDSKAYHDVSLVARDEMLDRRSNQFLPLPGLFLGAGAFLLLIACANVTSLFYVRAAERAGEMAVRASLGARRLRLIRQTLTECLALSAIAAILGTAAAFLLVKLFLHFIPTSGFPSWFHIALDFRVSAFVSVVTAVVTIVVGLSPAREGTRFDLVQTLKRGGDGGMSSSNAARGSKRGLVVQLALSVVLFVSGALLLRSFQRMSAIDVGYPASRIAMVQAYFTPGDRDDVSSRMQYAEETADQSARSSAVGAVATRGFFYRTRKPEIAGARHVPTEPRRYRLELIPDHDSSRAVGFRLQNYRQYVVSDGYFNLLGLKIRAGRGFGPQDATGAQGAAVISAQAAKLLWGSMNPLGRTVEMGGSDDPLTVIGVVDDIRDLVGGGRGFNADPGITIYLSTRQALTFNPTILATGPVNVAAARSAVVEVARRIDPLAIIDQRTTTMASQFDQAFLVTKVFGSVIAALAGSALLLSIIGIYGVVAFGVAQRTREIGIRIALGGTTSEILRWFTTDALRFVGIGLAIGLVASLSVSRLMKIMLYDVSPLDPIVYGSVTLIFGAVAVLACYLPARRVTRVDPLIALRAD